MPFVKVIIITGILMIAGYVIYGLELRIDENIIFLGILVCFSDLTEYKPYYRRPDPEKYLTPDEKKLCKVSIRLYPLWKGGIGLPYFRVYNHMIFPVCFVNSQGKPVTQTGCVRICKRFFILFKGAKLKLISNVIDGNKIKEGMKFYIFNQREVMGEGVVEKCLYHSNE